MTDTKYFVISGIEDIIEDDAIVGKKVTDANGNSLKVKVGRGGSLKQKWDTLVAGKAYNFYMGAFKGYPFVEDFSETTAQETAPETKRESLDKSPNPEYEKRISIEAQNAYTGIITLLANKIIDLKHPLAITALSYASSKLFRWSSVGEDTQEEPLVKDATPLATPDQIKEILATAKKEGYTAELAISIMSRLWHKSASKALTTREADEFIAVMKQGKYLEDREPF